MVYVNHPLLMKAFLSEEKSVISPQQLKEEIILHHRECNPSIWKVLLETVGLCSANHTKENIYNEIEYKLLFKYSFLEYLAHYSIDLDRENEGITAIESLLNDMIVVGEIKYNNCLIYGCSGSCEQIYSCLLKISKRNTFDAHHMNCSSIGKSLLKLSSMDRKLVRFRFRNPIEIDRKILHQIHIDIKRLPSHFLIFDKKDISYMFYNILVLVSHRRPHVGYIQGMADLLVPFVYEFAREDFETAESGAYFCYLKIIDRVQNNLVCLQKDLLFYFSSKLEKIDPELFAFFKKTKLDIHLFAFRWFNCLYFREFPYLVYKKIFTTMLSYDNLDDFLIYFGISIVVNFKTKMFEKDFGDNILFLQNLIAFDWTNKTIENLLNTTFIYFKTFGEIKN